MREICLFSIYLNIQSFIYISVKSQYIYFILWIIIQYYCISHIFSDALTSGVLLTLERLSLPGLAKS